MDLSAVFTWILVFVLTICERTTSVFSDGETLSPNFDVPIVNVTATSGTTAVLPCTINYIGDKTVVWMAPRGKMLTLSDKRIIHDQRISVERPFMKDWNLHIRQVNQSDSGEYLCQINTKPVKSKKILLHINEPPLILETSGDQTVLEGETVSLWCRVSGIPYPKITWYRKFATDEHTPKEEIGSSGEELKIHNISRYCEDVYECVADNGIGTEAKREMKVTVQFPPEVQLYSNRMSQYKGRETILDCRITANPHGFEVWKRAGKEIINSWKYGVNVYEDDMYTKILSLRIGNIDEDDYGKYKCFASNSFGSDAEDMLLYEYAPRVIPTTRKTTTTSKDWHIESGGFASDESGYHVNRYITPAIYTPRYQPVGKSRGVRGSSTTTHSQQSILIVVYVTLSVLNVCFL